MLLVGVIRLRRLVIDRWAWVCFLLSFFVVFGSSRVANHKISRVFGWILTFIAQVLFRYEKSDLFLPDFISYDNLIVDSTTTTGQAECTDPALIESLLIPSSAAVEQAEARAPAGPPWARSFMNLNSAVTVSVWEIILCAVLGTCVMCVRVHSSIRVE